MSGKVLIYGGSGAVGSASARLLKEMGYDLHLAGSNEEKLEKIANELGAGMSVADIRDPESFKRVSEEAGKDLAGLIYAVGTINLKSVRRLEAEEFMNDFKMNALGAVLAVQAAIPALKKHQGSSVVFYSSVAVQQGLSMHSSLSMAKGAVEGLVRALAAELAPQIRVNGIAPSLLQDSDLSLGILKDQNAIDSMAKNHALKRLGKSKDIASLTSFLISDRAGWITGQIIGVDGGRSVIQV
ncbi:dehydrogenase [Peptoclostridium acidaminophilum DSM 3953]|uniref:Dehydrogenase n=1 Tax=Peptoclostridium acidaminophilum DSM 3953 TaxID=1286171 RepID=W8TIG9_PEPAC|nr:SDR family oxidoreductase [Peptoclostridium acidaminophilum]AHM56002.1 dehydrogenase [Peptoclostridium acidaminophilum DSM 3953]